jgi:hypothetical protein
MSVSIGPGATTLTVMLRVDEAGLGGGVVGLPGGAEVGADRRHEDDAPEPGPHHLLADRPGQPERAGEVRVDHRREVLVRHPHEQPVAGHAGVGDQDLDGSELVLNARQRGVHGVGVGDVAGDGQCTVDLAARARQARDPVAVGDEGLRAGQPDAPVAAGDEDGSRRHGRASLSNQRSTA